MKKLGLTIIEALIALSLLGIILAGVAPTLTAYTGINRKTEVRSTAAYLAQQELDTLRNRSFSTWPDNATTETKTFDSRTYTVTYIICTQGSANCKTGPNTRQIKLSIQYLGEEVYHVETIYTAFD